MNVLIDVCFCLVCLRHFAFCLNFCGFMLLVFPFFTFVGFLFCFYLVFGFLSFAFLRSSLCGHKNAWPIFPKNETNIHDPALFLFGNCTGSFSRHMQWHFERMAIKARAERIGLLMRKNTRYLNDFIVKRTAFEGKQTQNKPSQEISRVCLRYLLFQAHLRYSFFWKNVPTPG